jgi:hypothetical protein
MGEAPVADWQKLALDSILADGAIDETEVKILKKELYADGKIDKQELAWLLKLREAAQKRAKGKDLHPAFEKLFFDVIYNRVVNNGVINKEGVALLRSAIFADKKVDEGEKKFLGRIKKGLTRPNAEFDKLCAECLGTKPAAKAAPKAKAKAKPAAPKAAPTPAPAPAPVF